MAEIKLPVRVVPFGALGGPEWWDGWACWRVEDQRGLLLLVRSDAAASHRTTADNIATALNEHAALRARAEDAEAERDKAVVRAIVAEVQVARVRRLAEVWRREAHKPGSRLIPVGEAGLGAIDAYDRAARELLAALDGDKGEGDVS